MKKIVANVIGVLLGLVFIMASVVILFKLAPDPKLPPDSDMAKFMSLFMATGYMTFVKIFELIGGILILIPKLRNFGLLVLGPIILNIAGFDFLVAHERFDPILAVIVALTLYLLWDARKKFAGLMN
jgi:uncharacterized membrane protein YphA (DoxX/SURF4 family)